MYSYALMPSPLGKVAERLRGRKRLFPPALVQQSLPFPLHLFSQPFGLPASPKGKPFSAFPSGEGYFYFQNLRFSQAFSQEDFSSFSSSTSWI